MKVKILPLVITILLAIIIASNSSAQENHEISKKPESSPLPAKSPLNKQIKNSIGMKFVYIEPGSFTMGSPTKEKGRNDDEAQHQVTLTNGFYMQTTEVTQGSSRIG
ncbi:MAG: SUMF1/EgtB/PvdO family nonheme iron enzyme [Deltaproteobacteria bacterium]|nr:SUMF1/EgtB/PvdO family nonheme iron enzyme [Deltaproteobacteria bacterium]MBW1856133.1 SUMF1/EgtB/PvdO family nonheme iron enzyme [Deltaproteobacteria bacterium]